MAYYLSTFLILLYLVSETSGIPCDARCGQAPYRGICDTATGRCRCFWGWTGSNAQFVPSTLNVIDADHCNEACHYSHDVRNQECISGSTNPITNPIADAPQDCHPKCEEHFVRDGSECLPNGRCLCFWGWKGPNAVYITSGVNTGKILADYCTEACHYTDQSLNPDCATVP